MKYIILFLVAFVPTEAFSDIWKNFKITHSKSYKNIEEENQRYNIFLANFQKIKEHNEKFKNGESSYEMGVNQFTDMTAEEFENTLNNLPATLPDFNIKKAEFDSVEDFPVVVDWTRAGAVTAVKNQQQCGSCWAFSVVGSVESHHYLKRKNLFSLSDQQLVDCLPWFGCKGGQTDQAMQYVVNNGLMLQKDYPYEAKGGSCRYNSSKVAVRIGGFERINRDDEEDLKRAVASKGPVSVRITVTSSFSAYKSGVYDDPSCPSQYWQTNHAVVVTGYGTENGKDYWLVKNSWSSNWGENGYVKMARNAHNQCGIASIALIPVS